MTEPGNRDAYLSAVIEIEWKGVTWIGRPSDSTTTPADGPSKPEFLNIDSVVITAWNPNGEVCAASENARLNLLLRSDLEKTGMTFFDCLGRDESGQHFEESFLVVCFAENQAEEVLDLARHYCQEAVFLLHAEARVLRFVKFEQKEFRQMFNWGLS